MEAYVKYVQVVHMLVVIVFFLSKKSSGYDNQRFSKVDQRLFIACFLFW